MTAQLIFKDSVVGQAEVEQNQLVPVRDSAWGLDFEGQWKAARIVVMTRALNWGLSPESVI